MVGVPRSTGCQLCVRRRVRCDQGRPGCCNCAKYGAACPGYERALKFVTVKHQRRAHGRQPPAPDPSAEDGAASTPGVSAGSQLVRLEDAAADIAKLTIAPSKNTGQLAAALLQSNFSESSWGMGMFTSWYVGAPERLGSSVALDTAMASFALHVLGKANNDSALVQESRLIYGRSLGALQKALEHPVHWRSPETLGATMLLCYFELFAGTANDSWMKHAAGVSRLVQQRGPGAYDSPWEQAMLYSFRPIIISNALFSLQDCFLAKSSWQGLVLKILEDSRSPARFAPGLHDQYLCHLAQVPGILRRASAAREVKDRDMATDAETLLLSQKTERLRSKFMSWFKRYSALGFGPTEVASCDPESIFDTVFSYGNVWVGSVYMGYWATMLILQESITRGRHSADYTESNKELIVNVLRSVESVAADTMGPYRVGYSMRIAYEFADARTQVWIMSLLARFGKTFAASSPVVYPKPGTTRWRHG